MSNHKAKIVFADEVWKKIEWFTNNFDTEIGALGIVKNRTENGEKYFYVEDLLFPKQKVTGATVHFTPEMWGDLLKEKGLNGLKDIAFYWHRHPGNSAHSGTDDEDTFETFMSVEAQRKHFIFLQTAVDNLGVWNQEARIDIRLPIRHTILNQDIQIQVEESPEDEELRKECEAIAKNCIVIEPVKTYQSINYYNNGYKHNNKNETGWQNFESVIKTNNHGGLDQAIKNGRFGNVEGTNHMDNDMLEGYATTIEEQVSIDFKDGQATIVAGKEFGQILENVLKVKKDGKLSQFVRTFKISKSNTKGMKKYNLQPVSKKYFEMKTSITRGYLVFCDKILERIDKTLSEMNDSKDITEKQALSSLFQRDQNDPTTLDRIEIDGVQNVKDVLNFIETDCFVDWDNIYRAVIYDINCEKNIGELWKNGEENRLILSGSGVCAVLKQEQDIMIQLQIDDEEKDLLYKTDVSEEEE